jgi:putative hydrolase of HD superfamily
MPERLKKQIEFIRELDKLKQIYRRTYLLDSSRTENDAEHSWHIAVMALLLSEYATHQYLDLFRVVKMLLIHDIVEIDAGDTYLYDEQASQSKAQREQEAADRLFHLLPEDQATAFRMLWEEFEQRATPEAKFAASLDRFQPLLHNYLTEGKAWKKHGVTSDRVIQRCQHIQDGAPTLWAYAETLIQQAVAQGFLAPPPAEEIRRKES